MHSSPAGTQSTCLSVMTGATCNKVRASPKTSADTNARRLMQPEESFQAPLEVGTFVCVSQFLLLK
jgi:hypothetical protein